MPTYESQDVQKKETTLIIDKELADYINAQAKLDDANQVTLIADTILIKDKITLKEVDVTLVANYFTTKGRQVEVLPAETNTSRSGVDGKHGKEVQVIARDIGQVRFHLPGLEGTKGRDGKNGKNGKKGEINKIGDVSNGTPGNNGEDGGHGGNGGQLSVYTQDEDHKVRLTAPGGKGGDGGDGGLEGTTFFAMISEPTQPPNDPIQPDPGRGTQIQSSKISIKAKKEKDGKNGDRGRRGIKGKKETRLISDNQFKKSIRDHSYPERKNLKQTGWQIHFSK
ncbi:hypothetical protein [Catalinimonas alkaloidigena]|uniref:hypothetical protein n=1 Tax=Catalinimonas alkaloidigena TaxID=1075417 RepID=UPI0024061825|nr:hypothetical protein [Catalinimonas alkaloidigena]